MSNESGQHRTTIAAIADDRAGEWYFHGLFKGVSDLTHESGINLIVATGIVMRGDCPLRDLVGKDSADGILAVAAILSNNEKDPAELVKFFERYKPLPCVCTSETIGDLHYATINNRAGMGEIVNHLIEAHHFNKIAFIRGPETNQEAEIRFAAYRDMLYQHEIAFNPDLVANGNWSHASGGAAVHTLMEIRRCDFQAIVAANDDMATGAIEALHARGKRVPSDIPVTGFDNDIGTGFSLTTVNQPIYELGRRSASMLVDLIHGIDVPRQVTLPTEMIVRRSCGCFAAQIKESVAQASAGGGRPLAELFSERRLAILSAMTRAAGGKLTDVTPEWLELLFSAFEREILQEKRGDFLSALDGLLIQKWMEKQDLATWQSIVSVLRREFLPCFSRAEDAANAENIWHQARVLISEAAGRVHAHNREQTAMQTLRMMEVNATYYSTDIKGLADAFARKLPALGIERCYAIIFEDNAAVPEWARLILAYDEEEHVELDPEGQRFPARQLIPRELLPPYRAVTLVAVPLVKDEKHLGIIFFEPGPTDLYIYETLRTQFTEPLSRILAQQRGQAPEKRGVWDR
jgi:DNA-binding LacI/PurR family transcriptional regulator